ncbi:hypothetical protein WJX82_011713 [Trebouxia sp. C0006]
MVVNSELQQGTYCKKRREELLEEYSKVVKEVQEIKEMDRRAEQIKAKNEYPKARLQKECHRKTLMSKLQADHEESVRLAILLEVQAEREESKRIGLLRCNVRWIIIWAGKTEPFFVVEYDPPGCQREC